MKDTLFFGEDYVFVIYLNDEVTSEIVGLKVNCNPNDDLNEIRLKF
jgi:hypothetical protein